MQKISTQQECSDTPLEKQQTLPLQDDETEQVSPFAAELSIVAGLTMPSIEDIKKREVFLGPETRKHTLVLDIDNTLVYARPVESFLMENQKLACKYDVMVRPYAIAMLETMSKFYEIVLFTSGSEEYARRMQKYLDPMGTRISKAIGKHYCIPTKEGFYIKDLRIFADRNIKDIVIVDDKIVSFAFHLQNGIPVLPYTGEKEDNELRFLIDYLKDLNSVDDIRHMNKERICIA